MTLDHHQVTLQVLVLSFFFSSLECISLLVLQILIEIHCRDIILEIFTAYYYVSHLSHLFEILVLHFFFFFFPREYHKQF